jgi:pentatricopeptide repeat protein
MLGWQVTYNTLIDVYGKLGRWEDALQVLRRMKQQVGFILCLLRPDLDNGTLLCPVGRPLSAKSCRAIAVPERSAAGMSGLALCHSPSQAALNRCYIPSATS